MNKKYIDFKQLICFRGQAKWQKWRWINSDGARGHLTYFLSTRAIVRRYAYCPKLHEAKHHVKVRLDMDELDVTFAESKTTYGEIKKYVAEHYDGMKVPDQYITQVKAKYGIIERENYNKAKSDDARQPKCPKEKEEAIVDALRYFQMI